MVKIIHLDEYRVNNLLREGYKRWHQYFKEDIDARSPIGRLSPATLGKLAETGDANTMVLYSLIIGFLGHGPAQTFESLAACDQSQVLDIQMFMADHIRFEIMYRLQWLEAFAGSRFSLFEMVTEFEDVKKICHAKLPRLAAAHPGYDEYRRLVERDQQVFIRRLLAPALAQFKHRHNL